VNLSHNKGVKKINII